MKKNFSVSKRLLAALLSFVMIVGMIPIIPWTLKTEALDTVQADYLSMPITIRDYAADGILFEGNEMGETGYFNVKKFSSSYQVNSWTNYKYLYIQRGSANKGIGNSYWLAIFCKDDGTVVDIHFPNTGTPTTAYAKAGYFTIWSHGDMGQLHTNLMAMVSNVATADYKNIKVTHNSSSFTISVLKGEAVSCADQSYHLNNNAGFGLLATGAATYMNDELGIWGNVNGQKVDLMSYNAGKIFVDQSWNGTTYVRNGSWGGGNYGAVPIKLNSGATQTMYGGVIRTDLVEPELHEDGSLLYRKEVVDYLALLLSTLLPVPEKDANGVYNMHYIRGQKLDVYGGRDLAQVLRDLIITENGGAMGTYEDSFERYESEVLYDIFDIKTYYDAAYMLLHDIFYDATGYGEVIPFYDTMHLVAKKVNDNGRERTVYVFNSGYNDTLYDVENGIITNTQTDVADYHNDQDKYATYLRGNPWYKHRFNPLSADAVTKAKEIYGNDVFCGFGYSGDTYRDFCGLEESNAATMNSKYDYDNTNYHTSIEGRAQFVYYYDEDLFFSFTGDDDVYLYINNIRVLDVGGAHAISEVRVNLNDVAELCGLEDGKAYDFDFFYMERHGTAANFSIETNIKIVDPSMVTTKDAYQYGAAIGYNGYVLPDSEVIYCFGLQNNGEAPLSNLTFTDTTIGVTLTPDSINLNSATDITDLYVTMLNPDGSTQYFEQLQDEARLREILKTGIRVGETVLIYGFNYLIPEDKWVGNSFVNRVLTSAECNYENNHQSTRKLHGVADFVVQKQTYLIDPVNIYTWGKINSQGEFVDGKSLPVELYKEELLQALVHVRGSDGSYLDSIIVPDLDVDITKIPGFAEHSDKWFNESPHKGALMFDTVGTSYFLGNIDLQQYTSVTINYASREDSTIGDDGVKVLLTTNGAHQTGSTVGDYNENCDIIVEDKLANSQGDWYHGKTTHTIAINRTYNGPLYLTMDLALNSNGEIEPVGVSSIIFNGLHEPDLVVDFDKASVKLCSTSGHVNVPNINKNAVLDEATQTITYQATTTGLDTYYYIIYDGEGGTYGPVPVQIYTYGACDNTIVYDYGLPVEITAPGGISDNNVTYVEYNQNVTDTFYNRVHAEENYGEFTYDIDTDEGKHVYYTPYTFADGVDTLQLRVTVKQEGATTVNKFTGVEMEQMVYMAPASVMYYEDDFPGIIYINTGVDGNVWTQYKGDEAEGNMQDVDQTLNYGSDPNYTENKFSAELGFAGIVDDGLLEITPELEAAIMDRNDRTYYGDAYNDYMDWGGTPGIMLPDASNDSLHVLAIKNKYNTELMSFDFTGTGFEILSRTTAYAYAVLTVKVERLDEYGDPIETVKMIPVITECINGDLYQVPVIARKDLDYDRYRVTVFSSNIRDVDRLFYVDGVRIYHPLPTEQENIHYNANEKNAEYHEIKYEINQGNIVFGTINPSYDVAMTWAFGATTVENYKETPGDIMMGTEWPIYDNSGNQLEYDRKEYMSYGPNNEIYLSDHSPASLKFIALYLVADESVPVEERTIQVGAHYKYLYDNFATEDMAVTLNYGSNAQQISSGNNRVTVFGGTEQYYTIDHTKLLTDGTGKTLLFIGTEDSDLDVLALTNLKLHGYTIAPGTDKELAAVQDAYDRNVSTLMVESFNLYNYYSMLEMSLKLAAVKN